MLLVYFTKVYEIKYLGDFTVKPGRHHRSEPGRHHRHSALNLKGRCANNQIIENNYGALTKYTTGNKR